MMDGSTDHSNADNELLLVLLCDPDREYEKIHTRMSYLLLPIRACGTRWVCHKHSSMRRVLSKYGAYTAHLATLYEDSFVKPADRTEFKGYLRKWVDAKLVVHCSWTFRDIIFILLGTQGWQKILDEQVDIKDPEQIEESNGNENPLDAIDHLVEYFRLPLEGAGAKVSEIRGEFGAMIS